MAYVMNLEKLANYMKTPFSSILSTPNATVEGLVLHFLQIDYVHHEIFTYIGKKRKIVSCLNKTLEFRIK